MNTRSLKSSIVYLPEIYPRFSSFSKLDSCFLNLILQDVILASGCSGALEMAMQALANPGDNVLIPNPGFSLYKTIAGSQRFEKREYRLLVSYYS